MAPGQPTLAAIATMLDDPRDGIVPVGVPENRVLVCEVVGLAEMPSWYATRAAMHLDACGRISQLAGHWVVRVIEPPSWLEPYARLELARARWGRPWSELDGAELGELERASRAVATDSAEARRCQAELLAEQPEAMASWHGLLDACERSLRSRWSWLCIDYDDAYGATAQPETIGESLDWLEDEELAVRDAAGALVLALPDRADDAAAPPLLRGIDGRPVAPLARELTKLLYHWMHDHVSELVWFGPEPEPNRLLTRVAAALEMESRLVARPVGSASGRSPLDPIRAAGSATLPEAGATFKLEELRLGSEVDPQLDTACVERWTSLHALARVLAASPEPGPMMGQPHGELEGDLELEVARHLLRFPMAVHEAAARLDTSPVASHLLELGQLLPRCLEARVSPKVLTLGCKQLHRSAALLGLELRPNPVEGAD